MAFPLPGLAWIVRICQQRAAERYDISALIFQNALSQAGMVYPSNGYYRNVDVTLDL